MVGELPLELAAFAALLDAHPTPVREAFHYCMAMMMVEAGKARLIETIPSEVGTICTFESSAGERFNVAKPAMSEEVGAWLMERVREILGEVGV
jgi:hypothetical protein